MATTNNQKLKLLFLYRLLMEETDAEQGLSMPEILARLQDYGISAERKSIYRDIDALKSAGIEVTRLRTAPVEYAIIEAKPALSEALLLLDAVQSSAFLTEKKSRQLSEMVAGLVSKRQRTLLKKSIHVEGRVKNQNDSIFHNVDTIHEALRTKRKVEFVYFSYGTDLERHPRRKEPYVQTPVKLVFSEGMYYLVAWSDNHEDFVTYRVDRMHLLQVSDEPATRNSAIADFKFEGFTHKAFSMFTGPEVIATLRVQASAVDIIVDVFGKEDVRITDETKEDCLVHVPLQVSSQFFGWLAGLHDRVTLTGPSGLVEEYHLWAQNLAEQAALVAAAQAEAEEAAEETGAETAAEAEEATTTEEAVEA